MFKECVPCEPSPLSVQAQLGNFTRTQSHHGHLGLEQALSTFFAREA